MFDTWEAHRRPIRPGSSGCSSAQWPTAGTQPPPAPLAAADGTVGSAVLLVGESPLPAAGRRSRSRHSASQLGAAFAAQLGRAVTWHAVGRIGVTPVGSFPLLPQPLRTVLGLRARLLDPAAAQRAARRPGVVHIPAPIDRRTLATLTAEVDPVARGMVSRQGLMF
jgi:hypothetical protein